MYMTPDLLIGVGLNVTLTGSPDYTKHCRRGIYTRMVSLRTTDGGEVQEENKEKE